MTFQWQNPIEKKPGMLPGKPVFKGAWLAVGHVGNEWGIGVTKQPNTIFYKSKPSTTIR